VQISRIELAVQRSVAARPRLDLRRTAHANFDRFPAVYYDSRAFMTNAHHRVVRLQIRSTFEMLDFVQLVGDDLGHMYGLDDDTIHWIGVAVRESVINAIKHGNREDASKTVTIEFALDAPDRPGELVVKITDQGKGFEYKAVADPLAPENILKASGRGIFFMRSFMDDVQMRRVPEGGMEVTMVKKLGHAS